MLLFAYDSKAQSGAGNPGHGAENGAVPAHTQVPEGGFPLVYLAAAGISCAGAVLFKMRRSKRSFRSGTEL
jgi:hypothetical protein